jgi:mono/diheme cytochrome c family protein
MKTKTKTLFLTVAVVPLAGLVLAATASSKPSPQAAKAAQIARGKYLVSYGDCNACHTPLKLGPNGPEPDWSQMLAGHPAETKLPPPPQLNNSPWFAATAGMTAWAGPWGVSYAANLTPDVNTGMGIWTEDMFVQAMRTGKHMGHGRTILPPMPWHSIGTLSDDDLKAIFAYLRSVPAIANSVPAPLGPDGKPMNFE